MEIVSSALFVLGLLLAVIGYLWLAWTALQESVLWGLGSFLIPLVSLVFAVLHWDEAKAPFLTWIAGDILIVIARMAVGGHG